MRDRNSSQLSNSEGCVYQSKQAPDLLDERGSTVKNFILGIAFTLLALVAGTLGYLLLGFADVRGDAPPSQLEAALMRRVVHASVRRQAPEAANPFPPTNETLISGGKIYRGECSGCHGLPGKPEKHSNVLFPPAPELPVVGTEYSEAQVFWVAKHGVRHSGMFANGLWDSDERLWKTAAYIKRIKSIPPEVNAALEGQKDD
jgi:mono/diheme cytochrome c family protein